MEKIKLPQNILDILKPDADVKKKLLLAKGFVPGIDGFSLLHVLIFLYADNNPDVKSASEKTLLEIPENILLDHLKKDQINPHLLHFFADRKREKEKIIETIVFNRSTSNKTLGLIISFCNERIGSIICKNQERLLQCPELFTEIRKNPLILKVDIENLRSFLRISGIQLEGEATELTNEDINKLLTVEVPDLPSDLLENKAAAPLPDPIVPEEDEKKEGKEVVLDEKNVIKQIALLNTSMKVHLALKGNRAVRNILIKDSNKIVATTVIKNPYMTDSEALLYAKNKNLQDEVIRLISVNKEWTKNYNVVLALVFNPKTPLHTNIKFVQSLRAPDLRRLALDKNVPSAITKLAKNLMRSRT